MVTMPILPFKQSETLSIRQQSFSLMQVDINSFNQFFIAYIIIGVGNFYSLKVC